MKWPGFAAGGQVLILCKGGAIKSTGEQQNSCFVSLSVCVICLCSCSKVQVHMVCLRSGGEIFVFYNAHLLLF